MNEYLFDYEFEGGKYGFTIPADSREEAEKRLVAIGFAKYEGQIFAKIDADHAGPVIAQFDGLTRIQ